MVRRNRDEQMLIGKEIYEGKYTLDSAAIVYKISKYTARDYLRLYKSSIGVSQMENEKIWEKPCKKFSASNNLNVECFTEKQYGSNGLYLILKKLARRKIEKGESIILGRKAMFGDDDAAGSLRIYVVKEKQK